MPFVIKGVFTQKDIQLVKEVREEKNIPIIQLPVETETKTIKESLSFKNLFKRN